MTTAVHRRDHRSILAASEKRLLVRLARALPDAIHSDHLSGMALLAMMAAGAGFATMRATRWGAAVVIAGLVANWFGDSLDGTLARVRRHERPRFGYYVDHVIDMVGMVALFTGMAVSGLMTPVVAFAVLVGYLLMCAESFLGTHATGVFRMSVWGVGPTELRIVLAVGTVYATRGAAVGLPWGAHASLFDVGGAIAAGGLGAAFLFSALQQTIALYRAEPRPVAAAALEV